MWNACKHWSKTELYFQLMIGYENSRNCVFHLQVRFFKNIYTTNTQYLEGGGKLHSLIHSLLF